CPFAVARESGGLPYQIRLIPQLDRLKPGVRIVSHEFDMEGIIPDVEATVYRYAGNESKVYLWTTPLRKRTTTKKP
ncbi:MAG TPA: hypothetical protein PK914_10290, partial [Smithellaceae bacterium]|nr:hypothetical protein [Smithellaceae bacterium]